MLFESPNRGELEVVSYLPGKFHKGFDSEWSDLNLGGAALNAFLEGPVFDDNGNLFVVDIPFGRIFCLSSKGNWSIVTEYDGWPNGMKFKDAASLLVADHKRGLVSVDRNTGAVSDICSNFEGKPFHGLNDLTITASGDIYFTDQGQSGLHAPYGRLFRLTHKGKLQLLLSGIPSPNGLVFSSDEKILFLAVTRANSIWRLPITPDGTITKAGNFIQLSGGIGPDGLAILPNDSSLLIAHPGLGVWQFRANGTPKGFWEKAEHSYVTNLAAVPKFEGTFYVTESKRAAILKFRVS